MNAPTRSRNPRADAPPRGKAPRKPRLSVGVVVGLAVLLVLPVGAIHLALPAAWSRWVFGGWTIVSGITFVLYARDKEQAAMGGWRTPESMLHLSELAGGWAAAFLAQRLYRHKVVKMSYQVTYWVIVLVHQFAAADALLGWKLSRGAIRLFRG